MGHLIALVSLVTLLAGFAVARGGEPVPVTSAPAAAATSPSASARTTVGQLGYWPPSATVAVVHEDLGQRVPAPGLVRLGVIDSGLSDLAASRNRVTVRIELATGSRS